MLKNNYECKNRKASALVNLNSSKMPNAINEEFRICPNPSSSITSNASNFGKNVKEDNDIDFF